MKRIKKTTIAAVTMACLLCSCNQATAKGETTDSAIATDETKAIATPLDPTTLFSDRDKAGSYDESTAVTISLNSTKATTSDSTKVNIKGSVVTIKDEGVYVLSGNLTNGQIIIDAKTTDKVQLVLKGVAINCDTSAALYVRQTDKVFVTLAANTENILTNKSEFVAIDDNNIDGVVFAKDDITINGSGALSIHAVYGSGVVSKDELTLTGGTFEVTAAEHGFAAKDSICIADGTFQVKAGKDGFHSENKDDATKGFLYVGDGEYTITSQGDGFDAAALLQIDDGTFQIVSGGGNEVSLANDASAKGIKAGGDVLITKGSFALDCADDAVHTNGSFSVKGGTYTIASGDDGFHADSQVIIEGGTIKITKCYEGIEGEKVCVSGGDINIVASDDGMNAAESGEDSDEGEFSPQQNKTKNGEMPAFDPDKAPPTDEERPAFDGTTSATTMGNPPVQPPQNAEDQNGQIPMDSTGKGGGFRVSENCDITISGGKVIVDAKGDGIDSNGTIHISGGEVYVTGPESGADSPIDADGEVTITGGKVVACGSNGMFRGFGSQSTQSWVQYNLTSSESGKVTLKNGSTTVLEYTPTRVYPTVLISSPELKDGSSYTIAMGEQIQNFTMSGLSYSYGTANSFGNRGDKGQMNGTRPEKTTTSNEAQTQKTAQTS